MSCLTVSPFQLTAALASQLHIIVHVTHGFPTNTAIPCQGFSQVSVAVSPQETKHNSVNITQRQFNITWMVFERVNKSPLSM